MNDICAALQYILGRFQLNIPFEKDCATCEEAFAAYLEPSGILVHTIDASAVHDCRNEYILAFTGDGRAVAVIPSLLGSRCLIPSGSGEKFRLKDLSLSGKAYVICRPFPLGTGSFRDFFLLIARLLRPADYLLLAGLPLVITAIGLVFPGITDLVIRRTAADGISLPAGVFLSQLALFISVGLIRSAIRMANGMAMVSVRDRIFVQAESALMARTLLLSERFFEEISAGGIPKRLGAVCTTAEIILNLLNGTALIVLSLLFYVPQMLRYSPALTGIALVFLVVEMLFAFLVMNKRKEIILQLNDLRIRQNDLCYDVLKGRQKIRVYRAEEAVEQKWTQYNDAALEREYDPPLSVKLSGGMPLLISSAATLALIAFLAPFGIPVGVYITFSSAFGILSASVMEWNRLISSLILIPAQIQCLRPVFAQEPENGADKEYVRELGGSISVRELSFRYRDDSPEVLKNISFDIRKGEKVAIVGASGCGKSTLMKLLVGFLLPCGGDILYDGKSIRAVNTRSLRKKMGIVLQTSRVMPGSIADNMRYSCTDASDEEIRKALELAQLKPELEKYDEGLDHAFPDIPNCGLSGGQSQRFLMARALVSRPGIMVLDEAFSALDPRTLHRMLDMLFSLDSTIIFVSHRLSSVKRCDRILVMKDGVVAESGTFDELMEQNGLFAMMYREQNAA